MEETIKIIGYSIGDSSVGIQAIHFEVDLGIIELSKDDKEFLINGMIRDLWELHDNGNLRYNFSDEMKEDDWDYTREMNYRISAEILRNDKVKFFKAKCEKCGAEQIGKVTLKVKKNKK